MESHKNILSDEFDPVSFDLASGDQVKVALGFFWTKVDEIDRMMGERPVQYLAMRFYSNEDTQPRRTQQFHELCHGKDFEQRQCSKIWKWLLDHAGSRERYDHESADDFISHFEGVVERIHAEDEDMIEHLERLPEFTLPEAFDRIDDSIFTDQTDPDPI